MGDCNITQSTVGAALPTIASGRGPPPPCHDGCMDGIPSGASGTEPRQLGPKPEGRRAGIKPLPNAGEVEESEAGWGPLPNGVGLRTGCSKPAQKTKLRTNPIAGGGVSGTRLPTDPEKGMGGVSKPKKVKRLPNVKGPTGVPKVMSLGKASKPATLKERLVAGALQPSVVAKVLPCYEPRDTPEVPNHVKDMAADEGGIVSVVDATVAGAPVQTGAKETVGIDTLNDTEFIDIDKLLSMAPKEGYDKDFFELDEVEIGKLLSVSNSDLFGGDAELKAQAEAALDTAEVRDGVRRGHVASGTDTFNRVCGAMNVPTQLRASFWRWLQSND